MGAIMTLLAIASMVFWAVIGWRAMTAHERIARELHEIARAQQGDPRRAD